jgi:uncharacterized lipoprotein YddW (UPF0748 family)
MNRIRLIFAAVWLLPALLLAAETAYVPSLAVPPPPLREMRGAWLTTVANIDWPSKPGLPVAQQKAELLALLDRAAQLHLNAVFFQVRPVADAFYASPFEPWSEYLTGIQGRMPQPNHRSRPIMSSAPTRKLSAATAGKSGWIPANRKRGCAR